MSSLLEIAQAAVEPGLVARVRAACFMVSLPFSSDIVWHVAAQNSALITNVDGVVSTNDITDAAIIETLQSASNGTAEVVRQAETAPETDYPIIPLYPIV